MEIWKDVVWYEWYYQVSNMWNVKSLDRFINSSHNSKQYIKWIHIKKIINNSWYYAISLANNTKPKKFSIHRLVAQAFLLNVDNKPAVNHIDWNKLNNNVENLEWCTVKENTQHARKNLWLTWYWKWITWKHNPLSKKVKQLDLYGNIITIWDSVADAWRWVGWCSSMISECCLWKWHHKTAYWYKRSY